MNSPDSESTPLPPEVNPRIVFDRLFSNEHSSETPERRAIVERQRRSVLDFVLEDAKRLQSNLGATDRLKLDEYMTAVRDLEQRIAQAATTVGSWLKPLKASLDEEVEDVTSALKSLGFRQVRVRVDGVDTVRGRVDLVPAGDEE